MKSRPPSLACSPSESLTDPQAEAPARADEVRYLAQRNALIELTQITPPDGFEIITALRRITEATARTLEVARVGIWRYSPDRQSIECLDLYQLQTGDHTSGQTLTAEEYPAYFSGLGELQVLATNDAQADPRTCELSANYLTPNGIVAMMDVPIHFQNAVDYFLCNEHVGSPRRWLEDEKSFAVAIANLVSVALECTERARTQQAVLRSHQRFQSVAAATNDTIWDWDLETDAFWWNDGFANLFGWAASGTEATIRAWIRQIHPEDRGRVVEGVYAAIERGDTQWSDEYRFTSNNGAIAHVLDRAQVIRDDDCATTIKAGRRRQLKLPSWEGGFLG